MHSHRRIEGLPLQRRGDGDHEEEEEHHSKDSKFKYRTLWNFLVFFAFVFVVVPGRGVTEGEEGESAYMFAFRCQ